MPIRAAKASMYIDAGPEGYLILSKASMYIDAGPAGLYLGKTSMYIDAGPTEGGSLLSKTTLYIDETSELDPVSGRRRNFMGMIN